MSFKDIVLRSLSTYGWSALGMLIVWVPMWIIAFIVLTLAFAGQDTGQYS